MKGFNAIQGYNQLCYELFNHPLWMELPAQTRRSVAGMLISYYGGSRRKGMNKKSDAYEGKKDAFRFLIKAGIAQGKWVDGDELTDPEWVIELVK